MNERCMHRRVGLGGVGHLTQGYRGRSLWFIRSTLVYADVRVLRIVDKSEQVSTVSVSGSVSGSVLKSIWVCRFPSNDSSQMAHSREGIDRTTTMPPTRFFGKVWQVPSASKRPCVKLGQLVRFGVIQRSSLFCKPHVQRVRFNITNRLETLC